MVCRCHLMTSRNPELAQRMYALYDYMKELLTSASVKLDVAPIDEVIELLLPIKQAWDNIPESEKQKAQAVLDKKGS